MSTAPAVVARACDDRERAQLWFARHLWDMTGVNIGAGVTSSADRAANIRRVIVDKGLADKIMGRFNGKPETYAAFASRALGIELEPPPQKSMF